MHRHQLVTPPLFSALNGSDLGIFQVQDRLQCHRVTGIGYIRYESGCSEAVVVFNGVEVPG